jgi:hypothetical protein
VLAKKIPLQEIFFKGVLTCRHEKIDVRSPNIITNIRHLVWNDIGGKCQARKNNSVVKKTSQKILDHCLTAVFEGLQICQFEF